MGQVARGQERAAASAERLKAGGADLMVTGDGDLLALDPFEGAAIVTPARFLTSGRNDNKWLSSGAGA